jgi:hypothetical protein
MSYQQQTQDWAFAEEMFNHRSAPVDATEARSKARAMYRMEGGFELLERATDRLEQLNAILDAKTFTTPSMAYAATELRAVGGIIARTLPLRYALG